MTDQSLPGGDQAQPGQGYDLSQALTSMRAAGLDPTSNDSYLFAEAWLADVDRNAPGAADRYTRAAQQAANQKVQFEAMRNVELFDSKLANDPKTLWEISQLKAALPHTEQPKQDIPNDISDIVDPKELFRIARERGLL